MPSRLGEKVGWAGGWAGGFIWVLVLSVVWLVQGKTLEAIAGLVLVCLAVVLIIGTAPWKHPKVPYWKLMSPLYLMLGLSVAWAVWSFGEAKDTGLTWWSLLWVLPILIPCGTIGRRRWEDFDAQR